MKKLTIIILVLMLFNCNKKPIIDAKCIKIIIQDSIRSHSILFIVSYRNKSDKKIVLFANTFNKKINASRYKQAGLFLTTNKVTTPIGQFHSNYFIIEPNKTLIIPYMYNDQYPNKIIDFYQNKNFTKEIKSSTLKYYYNKNVMNEFFKQSQFKDSTIYTIENDFDIDKSKTIMYFDKDLTIEDIVKLVGGKMTRK